LELSLDLADATRMTWTRTSPLYALVFLTSVGDAVFAPLLPAYHDRFGLSPLGTAALLAATTVATLVLSIPLGLLVDRWGTGRPIAFAAALLAVALAAEAAAPGFWSLVAARGAFGVAYAVVWTAAPIAILAARTGAGGMGATIAVAGLGQVVGPACSGAAALIAGPWLPFAVLALVALPLAATFGLPASRRRAAEDDAGRAAGSHDPVADLRRVLAALPRQRQIGGAVLGIGLLGLASSVTNLMAPLQLRADGLSPQSIGAVLSAAALVWVVAAPLAGRVRIERVSPSLVGAGAVALGLVWLLPLGGLSPLAMAGFLVLSAGCRAPLNTFVYLLGRGGAHRVEAGTGAVVGIMNVVWAAAAVAGPLIAGAVADGAADASTAAVVASPALVIGALLLGRRLGAAPAAWSR
jgi:MFS family permease